MAKISNFIIGMITTGMIIGVLMLFMSDLSRGYGQEYDNTTYETYNQLDQLAKISQNLSNKTNIEEDKNLFDVIGGYFISAYDAVKFSKSSFNTFETMADQASEDAGLGQAGNIIKMAVVTIVIVILVFLILNAIVKSPEGL